MLIPVSNTAFEYNGQLIDVLMMRYDFRKCSGLKVHAKGNALSILMAVADELKRGLPVAESDVDRALTKYNC